MLCCGFQRGKIALGGHLTRRGWETGTKYCTCANCGFRLRVVIGGGDDKMICAGEQLERRKDLCYDRKGRI